MFGVGFEEPSHFLRPNGIQRCGIILGCYFGYSINFRAGGLQDGILTSESHNPLAPVSEIAFFWEKKTFYHSLGTLCRSNFTFYPHMFICFRSCLAVALSTQSTLAMRSLLIWPFFLVWMLGRILSLIFFHVQSMPPVCTPTARLPLGHIFSYNVPSAREDLGNVASSVCCSARKDLRT